MFKIASALSLAASLALSVTTANAQLARTYVSAATGSDLNNCDRPTPCRTFQHAHGNTLPKGEITVLDPGGYGAVTITQAISIINDGVGEAGVLVSGGGVGIIVSAGASDPVSLRGLTIKGIGFGGGDGIFFGSGRSLTVENCTIQNMTGNGLGNAIMFAPNANGNLAVSNTFIADNTSNGILIQPTGSGVVTVDIGRTELYNNFFAGLNVIGQNSTGKINVTVGDSIAGNNAGSGFLVQSGQTHATADLMVIRSVAANNGLGLQAFDTGATLRVGKSTVTGNGTGWLAAGAVVLSYGDNNVGGNATGEGAMPLIADK
jgi:hypothetical protein